MLKSVAISTIQRHLSFRTDLEAEALEEMKQAQSKFEREGIPSPGEFGTFYPWFLLTEMAVVTAEADEERVPLPDDFLAEAEESGFWRYVSTGEDAEEQWKVVKKIDMKRARRVVADEPKYYSRSGKYFRLFPAPTLVMEFKTLYYAADTVLGDVDGTNLWLTNAADLLLSEAGWHLAASIRDKGGLEIFDRMRAEAVRRLFNASIAAEVVNQRLAMGGLED